MYDRCAVRLLRWIYRRSTRTAFVSTSLPFGRVAGKVVGRCNSCDRECMACWRSTGGAIGHAGVLKVGEKELLVLLCSVVRARSRVAISRQPGNWPF